MRKLSWIEKTFKGQKWRFLIRNQFETVKHMTGTY